MTKIQKVIRTVVKDAGKSGAKKHPRNKLIVDLLVQQLKKTSIDIAPLYNARETKKHKNSNLPFFEMASCPTFSFTPDKPRWLRQVRAYVLFHYDELIEKHGLGLENIVLNQLNHE